MGKCIVCYEREATLPDRDSGSKRKKLCDECHALRLRNDLNYVLYLHEKKEADNGRQT